MAMRLGTENKRNRLIAMVVVPVALTLIAHAVWQMATRGDSSPSPAPPPASTSTTSSASSSPHAAQHLESASELDPTLHPEWMAMAENTRYTGTSRNIFSKDSLPPAQMQAMEKPIAPVRPSDAAAQAGPAGPPPIQLKFYGFATQKNGRKLIFLLHGEDIFIAGAGDVVDGRYKVIRIEGNSVVIEDLAYNDQQTLPMQTT